MTTYHDIPSEIKCEIMKQLPILDLIIMRELNTYHLSLFKIVAKTILTEKYKKQLCGQYIDYVATLCSSLLREKGYIPYSCFSLTQIIDNKDLESVIMFLISDRGDTNTYVYKQLMERSYRTEPKIYYYMKRYLMFIQAYAMEH